MAHRAERDRVRERERERAAERDDTRRREPAREPPRRSQLNEYFVDGEGIHREVMQMEICKYLGSEAISRPGDYNVRILESSLREFTDTRARDEAAIMSRQFAHLLRYTLSQSS